MTNLSKSLKFVLKQSKLSKSILFKMSANIRSSKIHTIALYRSTLIQLKLHHGFHSGKSACSTVEQWVEQGDAMRSFVFCTNLIGRSIVSISSDNNSTKSNHKWWFRVSPELDIHGNFLVLHYRLPKKFVAFSSLNFFTTAHGQQLQVSFLLLRFDSHSFKMKLLEIASLDIILNSISAFFLSSNLLLGAMFLFSPLITVPSKSCSSESLRRRANSPSVRVSRANRDSIRGDFGGAMTFCVATCWVIWLLSVSSSGCQWNDVFKVHVIHGYLSPHLHSHKSSVSSNHFSYLSFVSSFLSLQIISESVIHSSLHFAIGISRSRPLLFTSSESISRRSELCWLETIHSTQLLQIHPHPM